MQELLTNEFFQHTKSPRKVSGRSMGTIIEIITYYLLVTWNVGKNISIEIALPEYAREDITHNVEYSLHPVLDSYALKLDQTLENITSNGIFDRLSGKHPIALQKDQISSNMLLQKGTLLRNACLINKEIEDYRFVANLTQRNEIEVSKQKTRPFMIFECKRVGQDAKHNKGPQAIEKAKQGSYVARSISSLQKIRDSKGTSIGILYDEDNNPIIKPHEILIDELINTDDLKLLEKFVISVGIVSNHGNWFTSENQNKEMMVLSQSYDWVLFLTDEGLTQFINDTVLNDEQYPAITQAFTESYAKDKKTTQFTKVKMNYGAHLELLEYFKDNIKSIESWFNVIQPKNQPIKTLKDHIITMSTKRWDKK